MAENANEFLLWNQLGLAFLLVLVAFIILLVHQSRKRKLTEAKEQQQNTLKAQEKERQRIAANIHDDLVSQIHRVRLSHQQAVGIEHLDQQLVQLLSSVRQVSHHLSPPMLGAASLQELIGDYLHSFPMECNPNLRADIRVAQKLSPGVKLQLFRIVQELITNVQKHAQAQQLELSLRLSANYVCLLVKDDGIGLSPSRPPGQGLQNIQMRAQQLGAQYKFKRQRGTTFILVLPLTKEHFHAQ
ncbi:MAG: sensor histidine kinase [Salibacteraceae bacterium]